MGKEICPLLGPTQAPPRLSCRCTSRFATSTLLAQCNWRVQTFIIPSDTLECKYHRDVHSFMAWPVTPKEQLLKIQNWIIVPAYIELCIEIGREICCWYYIVQLGCILWQSIWMFKDYLCRTELLQRMNESQFKATRPRCLKFNAQLLMISSWVKHFSLVTG